MSGYFRTLFTIFLLFSLSQSQANNDTPLSAEEEVLLLLEEAEKKMNGNPHEAYKLAENAWVKATALENNLLIGRALPYMGEALFYRDFGGFLFLKNDDKEIQFLGDDYQGEVDFLNPMHFCLEALKFNKAANDQIGLIKTKKVQAIINSELGDYKKAEECYSEAMQMARKWSLQKEILLLYLDQAQLAEKTKDKDKIELNLDSAKALTFKLKNQNLEAEYQLVAGKAYRQMNNLNKAEFLLKESLRNFQELSYPKGIYESHQALGEVFILKNEFEMALSYLTKARKLERHTGDSLALAQNLLLSGMALAKSDQGKKDLNKNNQAIKLVRESLKIAWKKSMKHTMQKGYQQLTIIYSSLQDYEKAKESLDNQRQLDELIIAESSNSRIAELESKIKFQEKEEELKSAQREHEAENKEQQIYMVFLGAIILILGLIITLIIRNRRKISLANHQIKQKNEELEALNHTKDKFFSIISHDVKGPLNSLRSFSNLLMNHTEHMSTEEIKMLATDLDGSLKNLFGLLENLLIWARSQTGALEIKAESFELNSLIEKNIELLYQQAANKNIQLEKEVFGQYQVFADVKCIDTVIRNLTSNALKFTESGGKVKILVQEKQDKVIISVQDNGVGIHKNAQDKLFKVGEKHSTMGTSNEKGTGLGLLLCKEFVEKNEGTIWFESVEGEGTTFSFSLPKVSESALVEQE
ncbi:ATP-binding protein [Persicobacter sp. CCB-QB2]|uniref:tetratricopeptide repeat-containing sensor histidine kinase n=1 Tax=Persicobacter sp. CCB-QB2 TaxID=1561025 RepID=UPI0006A99CCA|nr:ATP-binding protein [Persicobacter sp. CCB-QB2]